MSPFFAISLGPVRWKSKTDKRAQLPACLLRHPFVCVCVAARLQADCPVSLADSGRNPTWQQSVRLDVPAGSQEALIEVRTSAPDPQSAFLARCHTLPRGACCSSPVRLSSAPPVTPCGRRCTTRTRSRARTWWARPCGSCHPRMRRRGASCACACPRLAAAACPAARARSSSPRSACAWRCRAAPVP